MGRSILFIGFRMRLLLILCLLGLIAVASGAPKRSRHSRRPFVGRGEVDEDNAGGDEEAAAEGEEEAVEGDVEAAAEDEEAEAEGAPEEEVAEEGEEEVAPEGE